jgi:hypothetical protein
LNRQSKKEGNLGVYDHNSIEGSLEWRVVYMLQDPIGRVKMEPKSEEQAARQTHGCVGYQTGVRVGAGEGEGRRREREREEIEKESESESEIEKREM